MARKRRRRALNEYWWETWAGRSSGKLGELVALACGIDPDARDTHALIEYETAHADNPTEILVAVVHPPPRTDEPELKARWKRCAEVFRAAGSAVQVGDLPIRKGHVRAADFATWAESQTPPIDLPPQFPGKTTKAVAPAVAAAVQDPSGSWPWGTYENALLLHLATAVQYFWASEDDRRSPALKEEVVDWIMRECRISKGKAEAIAMIIRPDDIAPGPRKKDEE